MKRNYLKTIIFYFIALIIYLLFINLLYYFEILNFKFVRIINYIFNLIMFFIIGYKIASLERKKGYLKGFTISLIIIIIFVLITLITHKITFSSLVYYLSLITSSVIAGIIGVTKKEC
ncbi:MAG: TIGR04086 family membrane protein [Bacilli bacterium]|nr:TIGR04086 family membrane protein [Bacilli bacterium]